MMQTTNDIFLGWHKSEYLDSDFYWRQLKDMKGSVNVAKLDADGLSTYIELCALCLARAHARTGDASAIAGYLGKGKSFDKAVANFAMTYADQNERDYQLLVEAVDNGRIVAAKGI
jgi:predicted alpha/beta hydrolase